MVYLSMLKECIVMRNSKFKIYKNKKLNNASFNGYNLNEYQIFLQLVSKVKGVDHTGSYLSHELLEREYVLTAKEFNTIFETDLATIYRVLKKSAYTLARTAITLEQPDLFETWEIAVCEYAKYNNRNGSLTIKFTSSIMPYLMQVKKRFVLYNLKEIANFGSLYTTRLYELIQEFRDTGYIVKSIEDLRNVFTVGDNYKNYANFKVKTFLHAINEINSQYDMNLSFEEIKTGRKVTSIKFTFKKTTTRKAYNPRTKNICNVYKTSQVIDDDKQSTLLDTDSTTPTNTNIKPKKKSQTHITSKEQLVIDIMFKLLEANPKLNKKEALRKARECVEID